MKRIRALTGLKRSRVADSGGAASVAAECIAKRQEMTREALEVLFPSEMVGAMHAMIYECLPLPTP